MKPTRIPSPVTWPSPFRTNAAETAIRVPRRTRPVVARWWTCPQSWRLCKLCWINSNKRDRRETKFPPANLTPRTQRPRRRRRTLRCRRRPRRRVNHKAQTETRQPFRMAPQMVIIISDDQVVQRFNTSTVLSRGVRSLFGPTRKSSPWGNFSDGGLNQSIKRRLLLYPFGWLIDWLRMS